jgi:hypothetical protein
MGLLNKCKILPVDPHVGNREPYEKNKGVLKKHALSLAEGARPVCPEASRREGRSHLGGRSVRGST